MSHIRRVRTLMTVHSDVLQTGLNNTTCRRLYTFRSFVDSRPPPSSVNLTAIASLRVIFRTFRDDIQGPHPVCMSDRRLISSTSAHWPPPLWWRKTPSRRSRFVTLISVNATSVFNCVRAIAGPFLSLSFENQWHWFSTGSDTAMSKLAYYFVLFTLK